LEGGVGAASSRVIRHRSKSSQPWLCHYGARERDHCFVGSSAGTLLSMLVGIAIAWAACLPVFLLLIRLEDRE